MSIVIKSIVAASLLAVIVPAAVDAADRDGARLAIMHARAKIEARDRTGVDGPAGAQARAALDEAQEQYHKHHEDRALAAAERASSLVDLALATAQSREADARHRAAIATSQE